ncbi:MAG: hypothetical protein EXQ97_08505 [Alphaproteobacteria bacterium]|nr:hypothetical protein [Alphaproteobacteria bacterium]
MAVVRLPAIAAAPAVQLLAGCIPLHNVAEEEPRATEVVDAAWEATATCLTDRLVAGYGETYTIDATTTRPARTVVIDARNRTLVGSTATGTSWLVTIVGHDNGKTLVEARTRWMPLVDTLPPDFTTILADCTKVALPSRV